MLYRAKILRVLSPVAVDAEINLGFETFTRRRIWLNSIEPVKDDEAAKRAVHCLVVMVGGKKVFLSSSEIEQVGRATGDLYRKIDEEVAACIPEFSTNCPGFGSDPDDFFLDVNSFMKHLVSTDFDVNQVKAPLIEKRKP